MLNLTNTSLIPYYCHWRSGFEGHNPNLVCATIGKIKSKINNTMAKISIYLDDYKLEQIDRLIDSSIDLTNRSALISHLIEKEIMAQTKSKMLEGAKLLDELDIGWTEQEEECAIIDKEVSG